MPSRISILSIASGIEPADLLEVRAPKPALRERQACGAFGEIQHIELVEDDCTHGYTRQNRESIYGFFQHHLELEGDASGTMLQLQ